MPVCNSLTPWMSDRSMNTTNLKKSAPQARRDFMAAVSQRLNQFGIHADSKGKLTVSTPVISGSVMQIAPSFLPDASETMYLRLSNSEP